MLGSLSAWLPPRSRVAGRWGARCTGIAAVVLLAMGLLGEGQQVDARVPEGGASLPIAAVQPVLSTPEAPSLAQTVVLIVIDGIRWQEIFRGVDRRLAYRHGIRPERVQGPSELTPHLYRLRTELGAAIGAPRVGAEIAASGPVYRSLPGYMELLSGVPASYCKSNRCGDVRFPTLLDDLGVEAGPARAALFSSWPHLIHAAAMHSERAVISSGRNGGSRLDQIYDRPSRVELREAASAAGAGPFKGDFRGDAYTARLALDFLVDKKPRFLFLSLGEADAYGHANNYGAYLAALGRSDAVVGELLEIVQRLNGLGHPTTLVVTTDHGRDRHAREHGPHLPESARVWLMAAGYGVERRGSVPSPEPRTLSDVAPALRRLLGVPNESRGPALDELFSY